VEILQKTKNNNKKPIPSPQNQKKYKGKKTSPSKPTLHPQVYP
jgi:hypothetical protein